MGKTGRDLVDTISKQKFALISSQVVFKFNIIDMNVNETKISMRETRNTMEMMSECLLNQQLCSKIVHTTTLTTKKSRHYRTSAGVVKVLCSQIRELRLRDESAINVHQLFECEVFVMIRKYN